MRRSFEHGPFGGCRQIGPGSVCIVPGDPRLCPADGRWLNGPVHIVRFEPELPFSWKGKTVGLGLDAHHNGAGWSEHTQPFWSLTLLA